MDGQNSETKDEQIARLTLRLDEMEKRVDRLEREMSALGRMEGAIKSIFTAGGGDKKGDG